MPGFYTESFASSLKPAAYHSEIKNNTHVFTAFGAPATAIANSNKTLYKALKNTSTDNYALHIHYLKQRTTSFPVDTPQKELKSRGELKSVFKELLIDPLKGQDSSDTLKAKSGYVTPKQKITEPLGVASFILGVSAAIILIATWSVMTLVIAKLIVIIGGAGAVTGILSMFKFRKYPTIYKGKVWTIVGYLIAAISVSMAIAIILLWNFSII